MSWRGRPLETHEVVVIAERKGVAPSQLALAWVLAQGAGIVPIPGTRRITNLQENVAAGERYAPGGMQAVQR